jgi:outer membrane protein TolC
LLDAQRGVLASELAQSDSQAVLAVDAVQLYKALGGGWRQLPQAARAPVSPDADPHA